VFKLVFEGGEKAGKVLGTVLEKGTVGLEAR
jgi:hypothetical protein